MIGPFKPRSSCSAVTIALEGGNKEIINLVLSAGGLELDVDHLKSLNVFDKAVTACKEFVWGNMGDEGIYDEEIVTSFEITKILVEDAFDKGRTNGHKSAPPLKKEAPPAPASAPPSEESY